MWSAENITLIRLETLLALVATFELLEPALHDLIQLQYIRLGG